MNPENKGKGKAKTVILVIIIAIIAIAAIAAVAILVLDNEKPETEYSAAISAAESYLDEDESDLAIKQYKEAIKIFPDRPEAYLALAEIYGEEKDVDELFDLYDDAEDNLERSDFKKFSKSFFKEMEDIIKNAVKKEKYDLAEEYIDMIEDIDEDKAEELRDEYLSDDIPEDEEPVDPPEPVEPAPSEEPEPDDNTSHLENLTQGYSVGEIVPDFTFTDQKGYLHSISEFQGKAVYINFFTTWCTYCFYELPDMEDVYEKYSDDAVFIMIDLEEGPELGMQYADDYDVTIPIYYVDSWGIEGLEIDAVPLSIVIDKYGVVHGNQLGQASYDWMDNTVYDAIYHAW